MRPGPYFRSALVATAMLVALNATAAEPDAGLTRLQNFLDRLGTLQADFRQEVFNRDEELVEVAQGRVTLQKPGRFRWDYLEPFRRVIVADGQRVWLYEADLDQVTVRALDEGLGETPAALLTGAVSILERFEFRGSETDGELMWVELGPRSDTADFDRIRLGFAGGDLVRLVLADRLGQTTGLWFSGLAWDPPLDPGTFRFEVPPGADVIGESEL